MKYAVLGDLEVIWAGKGKAHTAHVPAFDFEVSVRAGLVYAVLN